jgi:hypothetical protein
LKAFLCAEVISPKRVGIAAFIGYDAKIQGAVTRFNGGRFLNKFRLGENSMIRKSLCLWISVFQLS